MNQIWLWKCLKHKAYIQVYHDFTGSIGYNKDTYIALRDKRMDSMDNAINEIKWSLVNLNIRSIILYLFTLTPSENSVQLNVI